MVSFLILLFGCRNPKHPVCKTEAQYFGLQDWIALRLCLIQLWSHRVYQPQRQPFSQGLLERLKTKELRSASLRGLLMQGSFELIRLVVLNGGHMASYGGPWKFPSEFPRCHNIRLEPETLDICTQTSTT